MSRLAYLESLSRLDDEYKHKYYSEANITKAAEQIRQQEMPNQGQFRYASEKVSKESPEANWAKIALYTYLALNPYVHPVARLNAGLNVVTEFQKLDIF